jgi:hypothetical protein
MKDHSKTRSGNLPASPASCSGAKLTASSAADAKGHLPLEKHSQDIYQAIIARRKRRSEKIGKRNKKKLLYEKKNDKTN